MPVFSPKPNRVMYVHRFFGPMSLPILPMTMFEEWTTASPTVIIGSHMWLPSPGSR